MQPAVGRLLRPWAQAAAIGCQTTLESLSCSSSQLQHAGLQQQLVDAAGRAPWCLQFRAGLRSTIENQGKTKSKAQIAAAQDAAEALAATAGPAAAAAAPAAVTQPDDVASRPTVPAAVGKSKLRLSCPSNKLQAEHVGRYYKLQPRLLPEAFPAVHRAFLAPRTAHPRKGGCRGVQQEQITVAVGAAPSAPQLMHRQINEALWAVLRRGVTGAGGSPPARLLLRGPTGAGKSCAVAALVERARASGWLALYIPSATALIKGGYFVARDTDDDDDDDEASSDHTNEQAESSQRQQRQWDTPISAQQILLGMQQAHGAQLKQLPVTLPSTLQLLPQAPAPATAAAPTPAAAPAAPAVADDTAPSQAAHGTEQAQAQGRKVQQLQAGQTSLAQLVTHGLAALDAHTPVNVVLALIAELCALASPKQPVLLAVDDYNALYGPTGYGKHIRHPDNAAGVATVTRVPLQVEELRLANAMRLLHQPATQLSRWVQVVAAITHTMPVPISTRLPLGPGYRPEECEVFVPRFSQVEVAHALHHYWECGVTPVQPSGRTVNRMLLLTNGNAAELRQLAATGPTVMKHGVLPAALAV